MIVAVTPSFFGALTILSEAGHCTEVPAPGPFLKASLIAARWLVKLKVVPELSERTTTVIGMSGSSTSAFAAAMRWSFQLVIVAEEDLRIDVARQLQLGDTGQVVGQNDFARGHRQQHDALLDLGDFLVGHRGVAGGEVDDAVDEILDAGAAALRLVVDGHASVLELKSLNQAA